MKVLGHQLLRSGTSVAAHAREASRTRSESEFCSKVEGLLQEADESQLWLELLRDDCGIAVEPLENLLRETDELSQSLQLWLQNCESERSDFSISVFSV